MTNKEMHDCYCYPVSQVSHGDIEGPTGRPSSRSFYTGLGCFVCFVVF